MRAYIYVLCFSLTACFNGPGLFEQDLDNQSLLVEGTSVNGIVTGQISAGSSVPQTLAAAADSAISGSSVTFPPGALAIDTTVSIEQGAAFANNGSALEIGVSAAFAAGGPAVAVLPGVAIDASSPFSVQIPRDATALALLDDANMVVLYKTMKVAEGGNYLGFMTRDQLTITESFVSFDTKYFGSFQVAISDTLLTEPKEVETKTQILTKAVEDTLEPISWSLSSISFDEDERSVSFSGSVSGFGTLTQCALEVFEQQGAAPVHSATADSDVLSDLNAGSSTTVSFALTNNNAHDLWGQAVCTDDQGRSEASPYTAKLSVPKYEEEEDEEEGGDTLKFTGVWALSSAPASRQVTSATGDVSLTIECEPGGLKVEGSGIDMSSGPVSMTCPNSGELTIEVGFDSGSANVDVKLLDTYGGKYIRVDQGEESAETVLHKTPVGMTITEIDSISELQGMDLYNGYFVMTDDIDLSSVSSWAPLDVHPSTGNSHWHFSGDMHSLDNFNMNIDASSIGVFNMGFLGHVQVHSSEYFSVGHLRIDGTIQRLNTNNYGISRVGMLVGNLDCQTGSVCEVFEIEVAGDISISDIGGGTNSIVGGVFGSADGVVGSGFDADVIIYVQGDQVGGFVGALGDFYAATVDSISIAAGSDVQGENQTGGVYGYCDGASDVNFAFSSATVSGADHVGGLGGYSLSCDHSGVAAIGNVTLSGERGGGLIGTSNTSTYQDVYAEGNVVSTGSLDYFGGLIGYFNGGSSSTVDNAFATGAVSATGTGDKCGNLFGLVSDEVVMTFVFSGQSGMPTCTTTNARIAGTVADQGTTSVFDTNWSTVNYLSSTSGLCAGGAHQPAGGQCTQMTYADIDSESDTYYSTASWTFDGNPWDGVVGGFPVFNWGQ